MRQKQCWFFVKQVAVDYNEASASCRYCLTPLLGGLGRSKWMGSNFRWNYEETTIAQGFHMGKGSGYRPDMPACIEEAP